MDPGISLVGTAYRLGRKLAEYDRLVIWVAISMSIFLGFVVHGSIVAGAITKSSQCSEAVEMMKNNSKR